MRGDAALEPLQVLLVEDNPADADLVREAASELRPGALRISRAETLSQALATLVEARVDGVLLDLGLPDSSGLESVERLRAAHPDLPIVVLTGLEDEETGVRALELGAQDYLSKDGTSGPLLLRTVRYAIERQKRARRELELERAQEASRRLEALRASEAQLRLLADAIPQLAWSTDAAGATDYFNRAWSDYTGTFISDDLQTIWDTVLHPDDHEATIESWLHSVRTGEPMETETRLRRASDGSYRWFLQRALPVRDERGRIIRWFGTSTDIHEQKRAEGELRELNAQLAEADRRKSEFLALLSHELRNPLAPIRNSLYVLQRAPPGGEQAVRAQGVIARQVDHMARLVDDLLELTRISRGKVRLQTEPLELAALLRRAAEDHRSVFARSGVALELELDGPQLWVDGDATRLAQVVGNLLLNAAKFTPPGGRTTLSLARAGGAGASFRVRDTGAGLSKQSLSLLFQPFMQADVTLDRSRGGLGLGLALVRSLVELHGGTVLAHSEGLGRGAEFIVTLPLGRSPASPRGEPRPARAAHAPPARRVLVVEDNLDAALSLKEALQLQAHEVEVARTGDEGVERARSFRPHVVLCDIGLPGIDGYQVARVLRADRSLRPLTLVALSGYALPEDLERAREAGFDRHVAKPPDLDALERIVGEVAGDPEQAPAISP